MNQLYAVEEVMVSDLIFLADIDPDLPNPQVMNDEQYAQLVSEVKETGLRLNPPLVKRHGEQWLVVHGEHRCQAAQTCRFEKIPVLVGDSDWSLEECRIIAAKLNNLRGNYDPQLLTRLVKQIEARKKIMLKPSDVGISQTAWNRMVVGATARLPVEVRDKVRNVAKDKRNVDRLGEIIHQVMMENLGEGLGEYGILIFHFGDKASYVFMLDRALLDWVDMIRLEAETQKVPVSRIILDRTM